MKLGAHRVPTYGGRSPSQPPQPLPPRVAPRSARSVGALLATGLVLSAAALALTVQLCGWRDAVARGVAFRVDAVADMAAGEALLATELQQAPPAAVGDVIEQLQALGAELGAGAAMSVQGAAVQFALAYQGQHVTPGDYVPLEQVRGVCVASAKTRSSADASARRPTTRRPCSSAR